MINKNEMFAVFAQKIKDLTTCWKILNPHPLTEKNLVKNGWAGQRAGEKLDYILT